MTYCQNVLLDLRPDPCKDKSYSKSTIVLTRALELTTEEYGKNVNKVRGISSTR